jgi:heme o synthase
MSRSAGARLWSGAPPTPGAGAAAPAWGRVAALACRDYLTLTKPGITSFIVLTAAAGHLLAGAADGRLLFALLASTGLASGGASALNHLLERGPDARMKRTRDRPVAAARISAGAAAAWGLGLLLAGLGLASTALPVASTALLAASVVSYVLVYTPLKRVHPASTYLGAVPGALPVLAGWVAAGEPVGVAGCSLFAIVFLWQLPHFLAIAYVCREEYRSAGFRVLGVTDQGGRTAGRHSLLHAALLVGVAPAPALLGVLGPLYGASAVLLGLVYARRALGLVRSPTVPAARRLFVASLLYLPLLLLAMAVDRVFV